MKAIVQDRYGSPEVLQLRDVPIPEPSEGRVLIRVHAASVNAMDYHLMNGRPALARLMFGLRRPKHPTRGVDVAGIIESVGPGVTRWKQGDNVFGTANGTFAEFATSPEGTIAAMPSNLSFEQAAAVPIAAFTALEAVRDHGQVRSGQQVLVNGAGGGVGTFAVQVARWLGATVYATTTADRVEMVSKLGAVRVLDYDKEDIFRSQVRFDAFIDIGAARSLRACRRVLKPEGRYVTVGSPTASTWWYVGRTVAAPLSNLVHKQKSRSFIAKGSEKDLLVLRELLEAGELIPVVDREFPLTETAEAIRFVESGHARGKVVITMPAS